MTSAVGSAAPGPVGAAAPAGEPPRERTPADRVAEAVLAVPGVAGLNGGAFGEVATYLPGRRVVGVADRGDHLLVSVTAVAPVPEAGAPDLHRLGNRIRATAANVDLRPVDVVIADIAPPAGS